MGPRRRHLVQRALDQLHADKDQGAQRAQHLQARQGSGRLGTVPSPEASFVDCPALDVNSS